METASRETPYGELPSGNKFDLGAKLVAKKAIRNVDPNDKSFVPQKLIGFPIQSPKGIKTLPQLSPKLLHSKKEHQLPNRLRQTKGEESFQEPYFTDLVNPDLVARSTLSNSILSKDKASSKIDFSRKTRDVSYLMETKKYSAEKLVNRLVAENINKSLNLMSADTSTSFAPKKLQSSVDSKASSNDKDNIYLQMKGFLKPTCELPTDFGQIKNYLLQEESFSRSEAGHRSVLSNSSPTGYPKTIDAFKVGYGVEAYTDLKDTELKVGIEKARNKKLIEHRAQNKNLLSPSGRREVIDISEWLNNMLEKIYKETTLPVSQIFENVQLIYTVCLKEIIKQVKIQCFERGQLLEKIWEAYIDLLDRAINENSKDKVKIENDYLDEIAMLNELHQKQLEFHILNFENFKKEADVQTSLLSTRQEQLKYVKKKNRKLDNELKRIKEEFEELRNRLEDTTLENTEMKAALKAVGINFESKASIMHSNISVRATGLVDRQEEKQEIIYEVFDTRKDLDLFQNLNLIDKLEEELEGKTFVQKASFNDEVDLNNEEELYQDIGVDTNDLEKNLHDIGTQCEPTPEMPVSIETKRMRETYRSESSISLRHSHNEIIKEQQDEELQDLLVIGFHEALLNATNLPIPFEVLDGITDNDLLAYYKKSQETITDAETNSTHTAPKNIIETLTRIFTSTMNLVQPEQSDVTQKVLKAFCRCLIQNSQLHLENEEQAMHLEEAKQISKNLPTNV